MKMISKYKNAIVTVKTVREEEKLRKLGYTPFEESEVNAHKEDNTEPENTAPIDGDTESKTDGEGDSVKEDTEPEKPEDKTANKSKRTTKKTGNTVKK